MTDLPKRQLGRTGLHVTMLGYGAMELRGAPRGRDISEAQAETVLNAVLDSGINYIDTSIDYGLSEERVGRYLSRRRDEFYLASKCGCVVGAPSGSRGERLPHLFTRENIVAGVEQSLRRMKVDYIDIVQFHVSPSPLTLKEANRRCFAGSKPCMPVCHCIPTIAPLTGCNRASAIRKAAGSQNSNWSQYGGA